MKGKHSALVQPEEVGHAYGHAQNSVSHMVSNIAHQRGNGSRSAFCKCPRKIHCAHSLHLYSCEKMFGSMRFSQKRLDTLTDMHRTPFHI